MRRLEGEKHIKNTIHEEWSRKEILKMSKGDTHIVQIMRIKIEEVGSYY